MLLKKFFCVNQTFPNMTLSANQHPFVTIKGYYHDNMWNRYEGAKE